MYDTKIKEIKDLLIQLPEEKQVFLIFKILRDCEDKELENRIFEEFSKNVKDISKLSFILGIINLYKQTVLEENKEMKRKVLINYKKILETAKQLAVEFKLNNSLQLCNLYTYLLWNGYFSKNKKMIYQLENRMNIEGLYWCDVINGFGSCLNFSDMLTNFINEFDYSAATVVNSMNQCQISYKPNIERNKSNISTRIVNSQCSIFENNMNHTFNLINENGRFYIYDSTNLVFLKLNSHKQANLISGSGESILKPYFSYVFNLTEKATNTLDLFNETMDLECQYNLYNYINEWEACIRLFESNKDLLDDFYNEIKINITNILETVDEVQKVKKY